MVARGPVEPLARVQSPALALVFLLFLDEEEQPCEYEVHNYDLRAFEPVAHPVRGDFVHDKHGAEGCQKLKEGEDEVHGVPMNCEASIRGKERSRMSIGSNAGILTSGYMG